MPKVTAPKVRRAMIEIIEHRVANGITSAELVQQVRRERPDAIEHETPYFLETGLVHLASQLLSDSRRSHSPFQPDLFRDRPHVPETVSVPVYDRGASRTLHIARENMTRAQARSCIAAMRRPRKEMEEAANELQEVLDDLEDVLVGKEDATLWQCWESKYGKKRDDAA